MSMHPSASSQCANGQHSDVVPYDRTESKHCLSWGTVLLEPSGSDEPRSTEGHARIYQSLPSEEHIRVLRPEPGQRHSELSGSLEPISLDEDPYFDAVSYTWADEAGNKSADKPFHVQNGA